MPISVIKATVGFFVFLTASAISFDASTVPPGLLISSKMPFTWGFLSAFSIC